MKVLLCAPLDGHSALYISKAFNKLGHVVEGFDYRIWAATKGDMAMNDMFAAKKRGADLTLVLKGEQIFAENLERTILWNFDSWYAKEPGLLTAAKHAKLFLTPSAGLVDYYREQGVNAHYLPEAADPELHRPLGDVLTEEQKKTYGSDVSFIGTVDGVLGRDEWLAAIGNSGMGPGLKIWGSFPGKLSRKWHTGQRAEGDAAHNCVVSASKINLDRTRTPEIEGAISARVYRTMAAGGLVLMMYQDKLSEYLPISATSSIVAAYVDTESCIELIAAYLRNPEKRERIAKQGYQWVLKNATWDVRIQELLKLV